MLEWMKETVIPYLRGRPGALLMDDYKPHWIQAARVLAHQHHIELIAVPKNCTKDCQPLDISVFGPYKRKREQISMEERYARISVLDNREEAVNRAYKAWDFINKKTIQRGWFIACPNLEGKI